MDVAQKSSKTGPSSSNSYNDIRSPERSLTLKSGTFSTFTVVANVNEIAKMYAIPAKYFFTLNSYYL